jgi:hypothetical protein
VSADHGPAVSGAHNTTRAGKDVCSVLGSADHRSPLDDATSMFMEAVVVSQDANSFVQSMRKKNQLIMGIGHKIRTVQNSWAWKGRVWTRWCRSPPATRVTRRYSLRWRRSCEARGHPPLVAVFLATAVSRSPRAMAPACPNCTSLGKMDAQVPITQLTSGLVMRAPKKWSPIRRNGRPPTSSNRTINRTAHQR